MKSKLSFLITFAFLLISGGLHAQSFKVVVDSGNPITSLTRSEASDLFLKKKTKWVNGNTVFPVDLISGSKVREDFSQQIHGKGVATIRAFWKQAVSSGKVSAPPEKANDAEVIDFIKKNPGAIGYVSSTTNSAGLKVVKINQSEKEFKDSKELKQEVESKDTPRWRGFAIRAFSNATIQVNAPTILLLDNPVNIPE